METGAEGEEKHLLTLWPRSSVTVRSLLLICFLNIIIISLFNMIIAWQLWWTSCVQTFTQWAKVSKRGKGEYSWQLTWAWGFINSYMMLLSFWNESCFGHMCHPSVSYVVSIAFDLGHLLSQDKSMKERKDADNSGRSSTLSLFSCLKAKDVVRTTHCYFSLFLLTNLRVMFPALCVFTLLKSHVLIPHNHRV